MSAARFVSVVCLGVVGCQRSASPEVVGVPDHLVEFVEQSGTLGVAPPRHDTAPRLTWRVEVDGTSDHEILVLAGDRGVRGRYEVGAPLPESVDAVALGMITAPSRGEALRDVALRVSRSVYTRVEQHRVVDRVEPLRTWERGVGDCSEISDLTAAALRGLGIDARVVGGAAPQGTEMRAHAWIEYDDGGTWIGLDPTWDEFPLGAGYVPLDRGALTRDLLRLEEIGGAVRVYVE